MIKSDYDIAVIGGGIHGVGVAQAAAAAGYSVIIVEQQYWASGTSSKSSKLVHGGLRYLESAQLNLVRECLVERAILLRIAPHLVHPITFQIPVYQQTIRSGWQLWCGLTLYGLLAGFTPMARFKRFGSSEGIDLQGLRTDSLKSVYQYWDAQTDDAALTLAVLASARELGADTLCPGTLLSAEKIQQGYQLHCQSQCQLACDATDEPRLENISFSCKALVNAGGPWVNQVQERISPALHRLNVELVKGSHIVVEGQQSENIFYLEAPRDQRAIFVMPWHGNTLIGTTEQRYTGDPGKVRASQEEIDYLMETYQHYFPKQQRKLLDSFAGVRVLPQADGAAFHRSRETQLLCDNNKLPSAVAIYGGKLTSYRAVSEKVVKLLAKNLGAREPKADTKTLLLPRLASGESFQVVNNENNLSLLKSG